MSADDTFAQIIPAESNLSDAQCRAVIEIAATAAAIDRAIHRDEVTALELLAKQLGKGAETEFASMFAKLGERVEPEVATKRLRALSLKLESTAAREIAYKAALAIALADRVSAPREETFEKELVAALCLSAETAARLADEVRVAMSSD
jgi:hypothetical protein